MLTLLRSGIAAYLLLGCLCNSAIAHTSVWEITKNKATVYIGGTIHVLSADDYPLPLAYQQAYRNSSIVYFEVDIDELTDGSFISMLGRQSTYALGQSLRDNLSKETWLQLGLT